MFRIRVKQADTLRHHAIRRAIENGRYKPERFSGKLSKVIEYEVLRHYHQVCGVWAARVFLRQNPEGLSGVHNVHGHDFRTPYGNILVVTALNDSDDIILPVYCFKDFDFLVLLRVDGDWRVSGDAAIYTSAGVLDRDTFILRLAYEMKQDEHYSIPQKIFDDFDIWYSKTYQQWNPTAS